MAVDKDLTPSVAVLMPVGCATAAQEKKTFNEALKTMQRYSLPAVSSPGLAPYNPWGSRTRLFFVRESQRHCFAALQQNDWNMVVYPNQFGHFISDVREYIRTYPVDADVIITIDSDSTGVTPRGPAILDAEMFTAPQRISRVLLADTKLFHHEAKRGLKYAGVVTGTHVHHPSNTPGYGTPVFRFISGPRHFEESLTFETRERAGHYAPHRSRFESLYRALTIRAEHGEAGLGFLDSYAHGFSKRGNYDCNHAQQLEALVKQFGWSLVMRKSFPMGEEFVDRRTFTTAGWERKCRNEGSQGRCQGFNQISAGAGRNRKRALTAVAGQ